MTKEQEKGKSGTGEHILICLSASPSNEKVIRTAAAMAEAFQSEFTALYVEKPKISQMSEKNQKRFRENMKLAEKLGAKIATVYGEELAVQIAEYGKASGVTKIVMGKTNHRRIGSGKSLTEQLMQLIPNIDIYIIPDNQPIFSLMERRKSEKINLSLIDLLKTIFMIGVVSLVGWMFDLSGFSDANIINVYILGVLGISVWTSGKIYGALASFISVIVFNFLFTDPRFTLRAYDSDYPVTFIVMMVASFMASSLTMRIKRQAVQEARKAYRTEVLLENSQRLQKASGIEEILQTTSQQLYKLLDRRILFYPPETKEAEQMIPFCYPACETEQWKEQNIDQKEIQAVKWVWENNKRAGASTSILPDVKYLYVAVRGQKEALAVAGIEMKGHPEPESFEKNLMLAILDECGLVLEKEILNQEKQKMEVTARQEALRANLLRSISHDLRTPLTSISGNAGILLENASMLEEAKKKEIYTNIYDDAMWLINLVENLLSITRIENGTMKLKMEPELLEEVFHEALLHLDRHSKEHEIKVEVKEDLLMAEMDVSLIIQVIINLMNNAIQYTEAGSRIILSAARDNDMVCIQVADNGAGLKSESKEHLFDMFYTANNSKGDGRRSLGLGLSLCKSIVHAHGGQIKVKDNVSRGTIFQFTLKAAEVNSYV